MGSIVQKKFKGSVAKRKCPSLTKHVSVPTTIIFGEVPSMTVKQTNKSNMVHAIRKAEWNLDITNTLQDEVLGKTNIFLYLSYSKRYEKDRRYNETSL